MSQQTCRIVGPGQYPAGALKRLSHESEMKRKFNGWVVRTLKDLTIINCLFNLKLNKLLGNAPEWHPAVPGLNPASHQLSGPEMGLSLRLPSERWRRSNWTKRLSCEPRKSLIRGMPRQKIHFANFCQLFCKFFKCKKLAIGNWPNTVLAKLCGLLQCSDL